MMWGMGWVWFWICAILVVIAVAVLLSWTGRTGSTTPTAKESPEEILKRRYAAGEIDREEYEQRLQDLRR